MYVPIDNSSSSYKRRWTFGVAKQPKEGYGRRESTATCSPSRWRLGTNKTVDAAAR
ncbi:hypothetical protein [Streptomyces sp. SS]|uniref:hypothetical protein n=1 Tax=Streptomyces sp. SS TaxID=260742 RepID=UPI0013E3CCA8|nr:hypothetical protein [Streptomyces sp. SS]